MKDAANAWRASADRLRPAFLAESGNLTTAVILRMLDPVLPQGARVLDLGGGDGRLAEALVANGAEVTLVDNDTAMLAAAAARLRERGFERRVRLVEDDAARCRLNGFDLVCCHSVLMYQADPAPLLDSCTAACRPGGRISVISLNPAAAAMRAGLQRRWPAAIAALQGLPVPDEAPAYDHGLDDCIDWLAARNCEAEAWFGLGIFTDHERAAIALSEEEWELAVAAETLAGATDPYRSIARCWHLIARRAPM